MEIMTYGSWDVEHNRQFFVILDHFLPFYPPNNPKNQTFEKMKNKSQEILSFYDIWFLRYDMTNRIFCHLGTFFALLQKIKIFKNWKKGLEISSFYTSVPKIKIICYTVPEIWRITNLTAIFHFQLFFALSPH